MSVDDGFSRTELELTDERRLPAPHDLVGMLRAQLEEVVSNARKNRGEVLTPEDTFDIQLGLAQVIEGLTDYGRAFTKVAREAKGYVEDELIEAVGEQDGIPTSGLKVPDPDGTTVVISRDTSNVYTFDMHALLNAVAFMVMESWSVTDRVLDLARGHLATESHTERAAIRQELENYLAGRLLAALEQLTQLGKVEPQVTKVGTFTESLARMPGGPMIASTVTGTTRKKPVYKGVSIKREQPK